MNGPASFYVPVTPTVKWLIIACVSIWVVQTILESYVFGSPVLTYSLGLVPNNVVSQFFVWEVATYMFLHSSAVLHVLFNMLILWWLGAELEQRWGRRFFLTYYLVSGIGAGIIYVLAIGLHGLIFGKTAIWSAPVVGASGAIFGLMLAYGIIFGDRIVYFMMIFPMRARWMVAILGALEVATLLSQGVGHDVANLAHIGGLIAGYFFLLGYTRFQQSRWRKQPSKRGRDLRLVVNNSAKNSKSKNDKDDPRYWN